MDEKILLLHKRVGKAMHFEGILKAIRSGINSAVVEGLNNKIRTAF